MCDLVTRASFGRPEYVTSASAWLDYAPLAFWLVDALRPECLVELGVHTGFSYFAFCQQIKESGLDCYAFGVDTWIGDSHSGRYGRAVLDFCRSYNRRYQPFSMLVQATFQEAADNMPDGSIDLLHIDGYHSYEAVGADYAAYERKLSKRAIVMFHDTMVPGYGVKRFFDEVSEDHPSFEFTHGCGLGLVAPRDAPDAFAELCTLPQRGSDWIKQVYSALGFNVTINMTDYQLPDVESMISATRQITA